MLLARQKEQEEKFLVLDYRRVFPSNVSIVCLRKSEDVVFLRLSSLVTPQSHLLRCTNYRGMTSGDYLWLKLDNRDHV